ncbi:hypothetical protein H8D36_05055 [archaeon]|nr:hypothetical protein [archaeon]MBL7056765.1 hypothetical protein [Candidatus Woesearchaeota archaeon]
MKRSVAGILLLIVFLITFLSRAGISMQTDIFSYEAYFELRQIENINENGSPLFEDPLSYGGRSHLFPPIFYYLIALFGFLGTSLAAKLIPNLLSSFIIVTVYLMSFHITKNRLISIITAFFSGFIPIFFVTVNDISVYSLVILLMVSITYFMMKINNRFHLNMAILFMIVLILSHSSAFLLILGLLLYLLLLRVESLEVNKRELELILFASFFVIWFNFLLYKNAFLVHGPLIFWQNIPLQILTNFFFELNLIQVIYYIGIIPVVLGIYAIYYVLFKEKKRSVFLLVSMALIVLLLLWLKTIPFEVGLIFLSIVLTVLSGYSMKLIYSYFKKTKFSRSGKWVLLGIFILFCLSSVIPSVNLALNSVESVPSDYELEALDWLLNNTDNSSIILARVEEGYMINHFAKRKTVIDEDFLLITDAQQRYEDVQSVFSLHLKTEALRRLMKYDVDYIYFSGKFGDEEKLHYVDEDCFDMVFNKSVKIYKVGCTIQ